jgi:hypothetical protein
MPIQTPLLAVVPAGVLALVILFAAWRPWKPGPAGSGWWGSALVLGLGYFLADRLVWKTWPNLAENHRLLPLIGLAGAAYGLCEPLWRAKHWRGYALAGIAAASMAVILRQAFTPLPGFGDLILLAACTTAVSMLASEMDVVAKSPTGARVVPTVFAAAAGGAALVTIQSHSASLGFTTASIAAVMTAVAIVAWWRPALGVVNAAIPTYCLLLVGALVANRETYLEAKILTILAAATGGFASLGPFRRLPVWAVTLFCLVATALLIAVALRYTPGGFHFGESEE